METKEIVPAQASVGVLLEHGGTLALAIAGAAYVAGILIANIYVVSFGFATPDLTQPRYVVVGALWLFLLTAMGSLLGLAGYFVGAGLVDWKEKRRLLSLAKLAAIPVIAGFGAAIVMTASTYSLDIFEVDTWRIAFILWATALTLWPVGKHMADVWMRINRKATSDTFDTYATAYAILWQISLALVLISAYAISVYPKLPAAFGGGKNAPVRMLPTLEGVPIIKSLGVKVLADGMTEPLIIVHENDDTYFTLSSDAPLRQARGRRVAKELIHGAVSQK